MKILTVPFFLAFAVLMANPHMTWSLNLERGPDTLKNNDVLALGKLKTLAEGNYHKGYGAYRKGDYVTALRELRPLAEQGYALAQTSMGMMYRSGRGVPKNYETALKWLRLAAEQGHALAHTMLGFMYFNGEGVIQDNIYAHMWGNIGASNRNEPGERVRDMAAKRMTPSEIIKAQDLASECIKKNYKGC